MPALCLLIGDGAILAELRAGFTTFFAGPLVVPALLIGVLYACLYLFGTGIYLDRRENTYCIPLNRCSSLLSGVVASFGLTWFLGWKPPSGYQLAGAGIILAALAILMVSTLRGSRPAMHGTGPAHRPLRLLRQYQPVADGPGDLQRRDPAPPRLSLVSGSTSSPVRAVSAGLTARPGRPLSEASQSALQQLGVSPHEHSSQEVTPELVEQAERIFCMTEDQCRSLVSRFPAAAPKVRAPRPRRRHRGSQRPGPGRLPFVGPRLQKLVRVRVSELILP